MTGCGPAGGIRWRVSPRRPTSTAAGEAGAGSTLARASRGWAARPGMDTSLVCTSSKQTDPFGELKIFAGSASRALGQAICARLKTGLGQSETRVFSEGNIFVRVLENVRGRDV